MSNIPDVSKVNYNGVLYNMKDAVTRGKMDEVEAARQQAIQAIQAESRTQQGAVAAEGTRVLGTIPNDYTALSGDVSALKRALDGHNGISDYYTLKPYVIGSAGAWSSSAARHISIPVSPGDSIKVTAGVSTPTVYAMLKSDNASNGAQADFCANTSAETWQERKVLNAGESASAIVPSDGNILYITMSTQGGDSRAPQSILINGVDISYNIRKRIDEIKAALAEAVDAIDDEIDDAIDSAATKKSLQWMSGILAGQASDKVIHFSIDDVRFWQGLLASPAPASIWDISEFANIKAIHEATGACITLMCFLEADGLDMADIPNTWANEFQAAKSWLRFALHARDSTTNYADSATGAADYTEFVQDIYRITGDYGCIDRCPRLANFAGTIANLEAMAALSYGIIGLLTADDARASYYLTQGQTDKLNKHGRYYDPEHEFVFIPSLPRLDVGTDAQTAIDAITARNSIADKYIEVFCHQTTTTSATNTRVSRFEDVAEWAASHGFSNGFLMDYFG